MLAYGIMLEKWGMIYVGDELSVRAQNCLACPRNESYILYDRWKDQWLGIRVPPHTGQGPSEELTSTSTWVLMDAGHLCSPTLYIYNEESESDHIGSNRTDLNQNRTEPKVASE